MTTVNDKKRSSKPRRIAVGTVMLNEQKRKVFAFREVYEDEKAKVLKLKLVSVFIEVSKDKFDWVDYNEKNKLSDFREID